MSNCRQKKFRRRIPKALVSTQKYVQLKYVHDKRSNMDVENIALVARATFNRPISYFREHDPQVLHGAFKYGSLKPLHDERKRMKLSKSVDNFEKEQELQRIEEQQRVKDATLLANVFDYIPNSLSEVKKSINYLIY